MLMTVRDDSALTATDLFCGAGGSSTGLREAGLEIVTAANHGAVPIATHSANFPDTEHVLADISNYDMRRLPRTRVLWASPICFPAGTTVLTMAGQVAIEDVKVGDYVLTHRGRWMPVCKTMRNVSDTVIVKGYGHNELETTAEHPFFARRVERQWDNGRRDYRKELGEREWVEAKNLDSHMWATPRDFGACTSVPPVRGRGATFSEAFWWMVGRWIGDGYVRIKADGGRRRHDIYICCADGEADGLGDRLAAIAPPTGPRARYGELRWRRTHPAAVTVFETSHAGLTLYAPGRRTTGVIEGRTVKQRASWSVGWTTAPDPGHGSRTREDRLHHWAPVRSVREGRKDVEVFNLSVVGDESYVADGIVVHNCTENSPAGGRKRRPKGQLDLLEEAGHVSGDTMERTRATFFDVIRAAEVHHYDAILVENVTEAADWELFDWWVAGVKLLGYNCQFVSVSSAHVGGEANPHAPQWRDRLYIVFTRTGIPLPDVSPKPLAWCAACEEVVEAFQSWKRPDGRKIGKFGRQYVYRCPSMTCRHAVAEPFILPAASAIDWSDLGTKIGDRKRPLAPNTMRRIRAGLDMFAQPVTVAVAGNTWEQPGSGYVRAWPVDDAPLGTRTCTAGDALATPPFLTLLRSGRVRTIGVDEPLATIVTEGSGHALVLPLGGLNRTSQPTTTADPLRTRVTRDTEALVTPPFITMLRGAANTATGVDEPLATMTTGRNHGLTVPPFVVKNYGGYFPPERSATRVTDPLGVITATGGNHALVVPYRGKRVRATTTASPLHTLATRDSAALVQPDDSDIAECRLRMLKPREHLRAQRFPDSYIVTGNQGEQTMQAGNAVSANVAHWLGRAIAAVL